MCRPSNLQLLSNQHKPISFVIAIIVKNSGYHKSTLSQIDELFNLPTVPNLDFTPNIIVA